MKFIVRVLCLAALLIEASSANAYTLSNSKLGDGFVEGTYPSFKLTGANNGKNVSPLNINNYTYFTETVVSNLLLTFYWIYRTNDIDGSFYDPAGYIINGEITQLSVGMIRNDEGPGVGDTSGKSTVYLHTGDVFGWYVSSYDSVSGSASLSVVVDEPISIPEPASLTLLGFALAGISFFRRKIG